MASATKLPLKSMVLASSVAIPIVLGASASRVNLRNLVIRTFTGPGSYSRVVAAILILTNLKNVPFAWHVGPPFSRPTSLKLTAPVPGLQLDSETLPLLPPQYTPKDCILNSLPTRDNDVPFTLLRMRLQSP